MITQIQVKLPPALVEQYRAIPAGQRSSIVRLAVTKLLATNNVENDANALTQNTSEYYVPLNVYLNLEQVAQLDALRRKAKASRSSLIRLALARYFDKRGDDP